jgi:aminoglycoside phosphotransferase (APT) family kinase protein
VEVPLRELDDGWDFKVLVVDDTWVVRWPRHRLAVEEIEQEVELLPVLTPLLPVEVPQFEYVSREPWLVAYRLIRGEPLVAEDPDGVRGFLEALHAVDVDDVPAQRPSGLASSRGLAY